MKMENDMVSKVFECNSFLKGIKGFLHIVISANGFALPVFDHRPSENLVAASCYSVWQGLAYICVVFRCRTYPL